MVEFGEFADVSVIGVDVGDLLFERDGLIRKFVIIDVIMMLLLDHLF